jgi:hypothetical protein
MESFKQVFLSNLDFQQTFCSYYSVLTNSIIERNKNKIDKMDPIIETYFKAPSHQVQSGG